MVDQPYVRRGIMGCGLALLGIGLWGGLIRLGLVLPMTTEIYVHHGALMVGGFLGTLIGFERAVALDPDWPFLTPVSCVLGAGWLLFGNRPFWGAALIFFGSCVMVAVFAYITWKQSTDHAFLLMVGASCWVGGNALWLAGWPIHRLVYWWMGFLVLTIAAERLELNRLMTIEGVKRLTYFLCFFGFIGGLLIRFWHGTAGSIVIGVSLAGLALWLVVFDVARRAIGQGGEQGFSAWCMVIGYGWLIVAGVLFVIFPNEQAGVHYDALLHSVFVGFVFSMIFGHSLIIFPTVIGRSIPFTRWLFVPLAVLHGGLILRVTGDLIHWSTGRIWGGVINVLAILLFFLTILINMTFAADNKSEATPNRTIS